MTQQDAFLQAISDRSDDPTDRLVFADWLEERDDPRAPCLRAELAATRLLGPGSVHGVLDVERHFGVTYTPQQLAALAEVPFSEATLRACTGTHLLFPGYPLTLLDIRARHPQLFYTQTGGWFAHEEQTFARQPVVPRWHLLRTEPVPNSASKTWQDQVALLGPGEEVPPSALIGFATILHFLATGQRLFEKGYVRTADLGADGYRVFVGGFDSSGFFVYFDWDDDRDDCRGLASARKVP